MTTLAKAPPTGSVELLAACRLVGAAMGLDIIAVTRLAVPVPGSAELGMEAQLARIARVSRFRVRRVALDGAWWRDDNGPLLGYRRVDGGPVALVPAGRGRYHMLSPSDRTATKVNDATAGTLAPHADMLYRSLPPRRIATDDLVRFGAFGSRRDMTLLLAAGLAAGLLGLVAPIATGWLVAELIPDADRTGLLLLALAVGAAAFGIALATLVRDLAVLRIETRFDAQVGPAVWDRLLRLPVPFFHRFEAGDLARRALGIDAARQALTGVGASAALGFVFSIPSLILLWYLDPVLALAASVPLVVGLVAFVLIGTRHYHASGRFQDRAGRLAAITTGLIEGIPKLRVAGAEGRAFAVWSGAFRDQHAAARTAQRHELLLSVVASAVSRLSLATLFVAATFRLDPGTSPGMFLAFYAAFGQIMVATLSLGSAISLTARLLPAFERARPILETLPEDGARDDRALVDPGVLRGDVAVEGLSFAYQPGDPPAVHNVTFRLDAGRSLAIVGPSGAGKTTLLRLLLGFETPASGTIRFDGHDLRDLDPRALRRQLGVVLQDAVLVAGDLRTNLLGDSGPTLDEAWEAACLVGLDEEIRRMPMGMHTFVAEGGSALSAGQRQRVLLARELVRRPRILLLDEATRALDARTQSQVAESLRASGVTRITIAHRLSTISEAELILVMDEGRIIQRGTYRELMDQPGLFAELARRQVA